MPRIAAIDFGTKRIGLAISDEKGRIALPLKMVLAGNSDAESIKTILSALSTFHIETIVVGLPLLMNGKRGTMAEAVIRFAHLLQSQCQCSVITWDERLSSAQAERALKEFASRKKRSKIVDSTAASMILQTYLDKKNDQSS